MISFTGKDLLDQAVANAREIAINEITNDNTAYFGCESKGNGASNGSEVLNSLYFKVSRFLLVT